MPNVLILVIRLLMLLAPLVVPAPAQAWWDEEWTVRKKITLEASAFGTLAPPLANVPVLVRLHTGNFNFLDAKEDGADLRVLSGDDLTPLKFHLEKFDALNEMALLWVQVPQVVGKPAEDTLWIYYGNPQATAAHDAKGTYDSHQRLNYHFAEGQEIAFDQTAYAHHGVASDVSIVTAGAIGAAASFSGTGKIAIPATTTLQFATGLTFSAWVKLAAPQRNAVIFSAQDGAQGLVVAVDQAQVYVRTSGGTVGETPRAALTMDAWHHLAVVADDRRVAFFLDGREVGHIAATLRLSAPAVTLGAAQRGDSFFSGMLDEVQIADVARPLAWLQIAAQGQGAETKLLTLGEEERVSGESTEAAYFGTILHSVTIDGWVVIGILMIMALISWMVMFGKAVVLGRARKDNRAFLTSFQRTAVRDPSALDRDESSEEMQANVGAATFTQALFGAHDHYQSSPLYRLYHTGIQEIKQRFGKADPHTVGKVLTPQALGAIRAALDAAVVRENQKLNKQMVLLTIAISGGPFLGLLGTVVGVMITFAAIAATGDVNINAIAPGIAAALVATVAGLAVAIPALFGYNYLLSHIKSMMADMQVFVDEFVHKLAEHYGVA